MNKKFNFTYFSPTKDERKEIESIRNQYLEKSKKEKDIEELHRMNNRVQKMPMIVSLSLGIIGVLIFGLGLTMALEWLLLAWGIVVMIIGLVPIIIARPVYILLYSNLKNKYGAQIIELSNKLLNEDYENTEVQDDNLR